MQYLVQQLIYIHASLNMSKILSDQLCTCIGVVMEGGGGKGRGIIGTVPPSGEDQCVRWEW